MTDSSVEMPPRAKLLYYLDTTLEADREFAAIEYAASGMLDLTHPETLQELDLSIALKTIQCKAEAARKIIQWLADHPHHV
ncbi:hypothetical protein [Egbenema bharatensis]|uniref:hypothetical protein n=1 Tax=Egbenema bharatensis TaxID=3463334 RepID=UPI003A8478A8